MSGQGPRSATLRVWQDGWRVTNLLTSRESTFLDDWDDLIAPSADQDHGGLDTAVASIGAFLHSCGLPMVCHPGTIEEVTCRC